MGRIPPTAWQPVGVDELEENAWTALRETNRNVCVTASAGAGKTEFLAQKAAYLLQTGLCKDPRRILAISFKRDAARNLGQRLKERCDPNDARRFDSTTFDGFTKSLLDRFGRAVPPPYAPTSNYRIAFPSRLDYEGFLQGMRSDLNPKHLDRLICRTPLPMCDADLPDRYKQIVDAYWNHLLSTNEPLLSFPMINRLVEYLLRSSPQIRRALHLTYSFVFLDEFQDTTIAQYELLRSGFNGSDSKFTAVGDIKQSIMGWADAMPDGFARFRVDFNAKSESLILNWRSHESLVAIQRGVAAQIDAHSPPTEARGVQEVEGDVAAIWEFGSSERECDYLADWIRDQIENGQLPADKIAILVRMKANEVEAELLTAFEQRGLKLRNLARSVGDVSIQDLLTEAFTEIVIPLLRIGANERDPEAWTAALAGLTQLQALPSEDERGQEKLLSELEIFSRDLRHYCVATPPTTDAALEILNHSLGFVGEPALRQAVPEYRRDNDYDRIRLGFQNLLSECAADAENWSMVLDRFVGRGQVPLMTVHKSKGLEFHTIVFFGLDNRSWWSLDRGDDEELNAFFVALTRARQRAFFTSCRERGQAINWIDELLTPAGVPRHHLPLRT